MRKEFVFDLGQQQGEFFVKANPRADAPSFFFVRRTRQDAIDLACQSFREWLRLNRTPAKSPVKVDHVRKYERPAPTSDRPRRQKKFGGLPIHEVVPNETITVSAEV